MPTDEVLSTATSSHEPRESMPWFGRLDQSEFELGFYTRILQRNPDLIGVLRALGEVLACQGSWAAALDVSRRIIKLRPRDGIAYYNLACALAMLGDASSALDALSGAIQYGYRDFAHLEVDPDLESVRSLPDYRALMRRFGLSR